MSATRKACTTQVESNAKQTPISYTRDGDATATTCNFVLGLSSAQLFLGPFCTTAINYVRSGNKEEKTCTTQVHNEPLTLRTSATERTRDRQACCFAVRSPHRKTFSVDGVTTTTTAPHYTVFSHSILTNRTNNIGNGNRVSHGAKTWHKTSTTNHQVTAATEPLFQLLA